MKPLGLRSMAAFLALLAAASFSSAQETALKLSTTSAQLGVPLAAEAVAAQGMKPDLQLSTTDTYAVAFDGEPKPDAQDPKLSVWPLKITPLAVGKVPLSLFWQDTDGKVVSKAELQVAEPAVPPDAEIADIKRPAAARARLWPWLLALAAAAAAWYAYKHRREKAAPQEPEPVDDRPAEQVALEALDELERSPLWSEGRYKEFYERLTDTLRRYLERRFEIPALKLTTHELSRHLRQAGEADRGTLSLFRDVFDRADLVKFAKTVPEAGQGGLDLASARKLVEALAPEPAAAPAAREEGA